MHTIHSMIILPYYIILGKATAGMCDNTFLIPKVNVDNVRYCQSATQQDNISALSP